MTKMKTTNETKKVKEETMDLPTRRIEYTMVRTEKKEGGSGFEIEIRMIFGNEVTIINPRKKTMTRIPTQ